MNGTKPFLLAIESAISGGSLALLHDTQMVASRSGRESVSRAEDLLPNIKSLLKEAGISKAELARIAVSLGPGSYTGLRIGIATVLGLCRGLGIPYIGVPLFEALCDDDPSMIAVPMGRSDICFATSNVPDSHRVGSLDNLAEAISSTGSKRLRCHPELIPGIRETLGERIQILNLGTNLAEYIGRAAASRRASEELKPIYVQNPRFG